MSLDPIEVVQFKETFAGLRELTHPECDFEPDQGMASGLVVDAPDIIVPTIFHWQLAPRRMTAVRLILSGEVEVMAHVVRFDLELEKRRLQGLGGASTHPLSILMAPSEEQYRRATEATNLEPMSNLRTGLLDFINDMENFEYHPR